jgi:hypothetical protein
MLFSSAGADIEQAQSIIDGPASCIADGLPALLLPQLEAFDSVVLPKIAIARPITPLASAHSTNALISWYYGLRLASCSCTKTRAVLSWPSLMVHASDDLRWIPYLQGRRSELSPQIDHHDGSSCSSAQRACGFLQHGLRQQM